jgi:hypothetical protein
MKPTPSSATTATDEVAPAAPAIEQPAENDAAILPLPGPDDDPAEEKQPAETDDEEQPPADPAEAAPAAPAAPAEATVTPQRLTAFDRGALRLLGKGDLIARLERAELESATLRGSNAKLESELSALKEATPKKIEAAAAGRQDEVAKGVAAELTALGITAEAAPGVISAASEKPSLSREEFEKLDHADRNAFFRNGGTVVAA